MDEKIIRRCEQPPGLWIDNVFYSDTLSERFLDSLARHPQIEITAPLYPRCLLLDPPSSPPDAIPSESSGNQGSGNQGSGGGAPTGDVSSGTMPSGDQARP